MKKSIPQILKTNLDDIKLKSLETKAPVVFNNTGWHFIFSYGDGYGELAVDFRASFTSAVYHTKIPIQL